VKARAPKVGVVDDDESFRDLIRLHLGNAGYRPLMAEDAVAAGHLIVEHHPSLVLIDVKMPYMDGYEFAAALKPTRRRATSRFSSSPSTRTSRSARASSAPRPTCASRCAPTGCSSWCSS
jgi:CheY-like chemotaxis protein